MLQQNFPLLDKKVHATCGVTAVSLAADVPVLDVWKYIKKKFWIKDRKGAGRLLVIETALSYFNTAFVIHKMESLLRVRQWDELDFNYTDDGRLKNNKFLVKVQDHVIIIQSGKVLTPTGSIAIENHHLRHRWVTDVLEIIPA